jgi:hypothetical protein
MFMPACPPGIVTDMLYLYLGFPTSTSYYQNVTNATFKAYAADSKSWRRE